MQIVELSSLEFLECSYITCAIILAVCIAHSAYYFASLRVIT